MIIGASLDPAQLDIEAGTTDTWRNEDGERHRLRSKDGPFRFDSGNLNSGESFSLTFSSERTYSYYDHRDRDDAAYFGMIIVGGSVDIGPLPDQGSVSIIDKSFRPGSFAIATGGSIEWRNDDGEVHTVTAPDAAFDSGIMNGGATFSQSFAKPGSYGYFCLIHPEMRGTIEVSDVVEGPGAGEQEPPLEATDLATGVEAITAPDLETGLLAIGVAATVSTIDRAFQPAAIEVSPEETVTWSNDDTEGHTVTAVNGDFNSGVMTVGDEFSHTFEKAGSFDYFCAIHPEMSGAVTVTEEPTITTP